MSRWMDEAYSNVSKLLIHCKPYSEVNHLLLLVILAKLCVSGRFMVIVGVHARRTDYKNHLNVLLGGKLVTKKFFEDAMAHIKGKYR